MASGASSLGTPSPRAAQDKQAPRDQRCRTAERNVREAKLLRIAAHDPLAQARQCRSAAHNRFVEAEVKLMEALAAEMETQHGMSVFGNTTGSRCKKGDRGGVGSTRGRGGTRVGRSQMVGTLIPMPVQPDRGYMEGDTLTVGKSGILPRCQEEGVDLVAWKFQEDKRKSVAHKHCGVLLNCAGRPGCGSGCCSTCRWLHCQRGGHQFQRNHPHVVPWHRSRKGRPRLRGRRRGRCAALRGQGQGGDCFPRRHDGQRPAGSPVPCRQAMRAQSGGQAQGCQEGEG